MRPDFGTVADDYATHRAGFPASFFERLQAVGIGLPGQRVADLGTGTGTLAMGFASRGCRVVGIDPAAAMLVEARRLSAAAGLRIDYHAARAEATGLAGGSADVVAAGQCWHWFDRRAATREAARVLRDTGVLVIAHFDWIPLDGNVVEATERLIEAHNPDWNLGGGAGLYPQWLRDLGVAGYRDVETWSYDLSVPYTPEGWRGRVRASAGIGASLPAKRVAAFDRALATLLDEQFPGPEIAAHHRVFTLVARPPAPPRPG
jgi:SAM-dependent methyltransferase